MLLLNHLQTDSMMIGISCNSESDYLKTSRLTPDQKSDGDLINITLLRHKYFISVAERAFLVSFAE